jgi:hypothetical protein
MLSFLQGKVLPLTYVLKKFRYQTQTTPTEIVLCIPLKLLPYESRVFPYGVGADHDLGDLRRRGAIRKFMLKPILRIPSTFEFIDQSELNWHNEIRFQQKNTFKSQGVVGSYLCLCIVININ